MWSTPKSSYSKLLPMLQQPHDITDNLKIFYFHFFCIIFPGTKQTTNYNNYNKDNNNYNRPIKPNHKIQMTQFRNLILQLKLTQIEICIPHHQRQHLFISQVVKTKDQTTKARVFTTLFAEVNTNNKPQRRKIKLERGRERVPK